MRRQTHCADFGHNEIHMIPIVKHRKRDFCVCGNNFFGHYMETADDEDENSDNGVIYMQCLECGRSKVCSPEEAKHVLATGFWSDINSLKAEVETKFDFYQYDGKLISVVLGKSCTCGNDVAVPVKASKDRTVLACNTCGRVLSKLPEGRLNTTLYKDCKLGIDFSGWSEEEEKTLAAIPKEDYDKYGFTVGEIVDGYRAIRNTEAAKESDGSAGGDSSSSDLVSMSVF